MRLGVLALAVAAAGGCAGGTRLPWTHRSEAHTPAGELVARADQEAEAGHARTALALYERALKESPWDPAAPRALHGIGVLRVDPQSPVRNHRAAAAVFERLATEHPGSPWTAEARGWHAVLRTLDRCRQQVGRCEAEASRIGADAQRLRDTLDALRDSDLELEPRP